MQKHLATLWLLLSTASASPSLGIYVMTNMVSSFRYYYNPSVFSFPCIFDGVSLRDGQLIGQSTKMNSEVDCFVKCDETSGCKGWTFDAVGNDVKLCSQYSGNNLRGEASPRKISGISVKRNNDRCILPGIQLYDVDPYKHFSGMTWSSCRLECVWTGPCEEWTHYDTDKCSLMASVEQPEPKTLATATSGVMPNMPHEDCMMKGYKFADYSIGPESHANLEFAFQCQDKCGDDCKRWQFNRDTGMCKIFDNYLDQYEMAGDKDVVSGIRPNADGTCELTKINFSRGELLVKYRGSAGNNAAASKENCKRACKAKGLFKCRYYIHSPDPQIKACWLKRTFLKVFNDPRFTSGNIKKVEPAACLLRGVKIQLGRYSPPETISSWAGCLGKCNGVLACKTFYYNFDTRQCKYQNGEDTGVSAYQIEPAIMTGLLRGPDGIITAVISGLSAAQQTSVKTACPKWQIPHGLSGAFKKEPKDTSASAKGNAVFECSPPLGNPDPTVQWLKNQQLIDVGSTARFSIVNNNLKIENIVFEDQGSYSCKATSGNEDAISTAALLFVKGLEDAFMTEPKDISVNLSSQAELQCSPPFGYPKPSVTWLKDGNSDLGNNVMVDRTGNLKFTSAQLDNEGTYTCKAENTFGIKISPTARLTVKYLENNIQSNPATTSAASGDHVVLTCRAPNGKPTPTVTWFKMKRLQNGQLTEVEGPLTSSPNGQLIFYEVSMTNTGLYVCRAKNIVREVESQPATLTVSGLEDAFVIEPKGVTATLSSQAELQCSPPIGYPKPSVTWLKDGKIKLGNNVIVDKNGNLKFTSVQVDNGGTYTCKAENTVGFKESPSAKLTVQYLENNFQLDPANDKADLYDQMVLTCQAPNGNPAPTVTWFKMKRLQNGQLTEVEGPLTSSAKGQLTIYPVSISDAGLYVCRAKNIVGEVDSQPAKLTVEGLADDFREEPEDTYAHAGCLSPVELKCTPPLGFPEPTVTWSKDNVELNTTNHKRINIVDGNLRFTRVEYGDGGTYTCLAHTTLYGDPLPSKPAKLTIPGNLGLLNEVTLEEGKKTTVISPDFPCPYPPNKNYIVTVHVPTPADLDALTYWIVVKFHPFELEDNCTNDYVELADVAMPDAKDQFCGTKDAFTIETKYQNLRMSFKSNGAIQAGGFEATLEPVKCEHVVDVDKWGKSTVQSDLTNLEKYPPNTRCLWKITVPYSFEVILEFDSFEIQDEKDGVCSDYIKIGTDGTKYCGTTKPQSTVNNDDTTIFFRSNGDLEFMGFVARAYAYKCGKLELRNEGDEAFLRSTVAGGTYIKGDTCTWMVWARLGLQIELTFLKLKIYPKVFTWCTDKVEYGTGKFVRLKVGEYCGSTPPADPIVLNDTIWVKFTASAYGDPVPDGGFIATVTAVARKTTTA